MVKSRKLAMVKRETEKERSVSFTKRRQGLFNKAAEFSMLCDSQIAVLVRSPSKFKPKKIIYSFGHTSVGDVIDAFLHNSLPNPNPNPNVSLWNEINSLETLTHDLKLEDFENSESVEEELEKLVLGLENSDYTCATTHSDDDCLLDLQYLDSCFSSDDYLLHLQDLDSCFNSDCNNNNDDQLMEILESVDFDAGVVKLAVSES